MFHLFLPDKVKKAILIKFRPHNLKIPLLCSLYLNNLSSAHSVFKLQTFNHFIVISARPLFLNSLISLLFHIFSILLLAIVSCYKSFFHFPMFATTSWLVLFSRATKFACFILDFVVAFQQARNGEKCS